MSGQLLEWGVATLALRGEEESGDLHLVEQFNNGALVAVIDGLGHGREAALAARAAAATLKKHARDSVISLIKRCHEDLRTTRGVVISMAAFSAHEGTMTFVGVGNVEGVLMRADSEGKTPFESLLLRRGVVGGRLPPLNANIMPITPGDTLILVTDGIRSGYEPRWSPRGTPQQTADQILAQHNMETDDALVFVARYLGNTA
jgi:negative regulator of sigma-B (phosphoserine phosphatase)